MNVHKYALSFDAIDDYIHLGSFRLNKSFFLEVFIRITNVFANQTILSKGKTDQKPRADSKRFEFGAGKDNL
jgi:hypothetical protein